jgi:phenylpropionate dioxygenase-like ring-hydroxylating dioxygenase large terminal subunit
MKVLEHEIAEERYPRMPIPNGWFALCRSRDLARREVRPLRAFGRELVAFRGEDGAARVLHAHCPHLGAHLGHGGKVRGNDIECPFHAWTFDGSGRCTAAPFAKRLPVARTPSLEVHEVNGLVFAHHHRAGTAPSYRIPELPYGRDGWSAAIEHLRTYEGHCIEAAENVIDAGHFVYFHGAAQPAELRFETDEACASMRTAFRLTGLLSSVTATMEVDMYGPGLLVVRTELPAPTAVLTVPLPIDRTRTLFRMLVSSKAPRFAPFFGRIAAELIRLRAAHDAKQERMIWDHKVYLHAPRLTSVDTHIAPFRSWYGQFL